MSANRWLLLLVFIPLILLGAGGSPVVQVLMFVLGFGLMGFGLLAVLNRWREYRTRAETNERRFAAEMIAMRHRTKNDQP
ncbi:MAG: hypothetical protein AAF358_19935 [Pseudomonadota bacterium]